MSLVYNIRKFCMKYKRIVCLIVLILLAIFLSKLTRSMKEGLETPITLKTCSIFNSNQLVEKNCANCLAVKLTTNGGAEGNKCWWNAAEQKCGSFSGAGYKDTCTADTTTTTTTDPGSTCTDATCPALKILDTPTWFKYPNTASLSLADTPTWITTPTPPPAITA